MIFYFQTILNYNYLFCYLFVLKSIRLLIHFLIALKCSIHKYNVFIHRAPIC